MNTTSPVVFAASTRSNTRRTNIVVIDPEIAEFFPDSKSVNDALRMLAAFIKQKRREPAAGH